MRRRQNSYLSGLVLLALSAWISVSTLAYAQVDEDRPPNSTSARGSMEVPAGSRISVRTNETIDSTTASPSQRFSAVVNDDVKDSSGAVMIPKGSNATLVIRDITNPGTTSSGGVVLDLDSVNVDGRTYNVSSQDLTQHGNQGIGKNRRTAEMVGGGAALGTLLGAIAGGGKGAVIGAIAGAAVGGTTQVLTRGKQVKVPAETVLNFQLDQPLYLRLASY